MYSLSIKVHNSCSPPDPWQDSNPRREMFSHFSMCSYSLYMSPRQLKLALLNSPHSGEPEYMQFYIPIPIGGPWWPDKKKQKKQNGFFDKEGKKQKKQQKNKKNKKNKNGPPKVDFGPTLMGRR